MPGGAPARRLLYLLRLLRLHAPGLSGWPRSWACLTSSTRGPTTRSGLGEDGPTHQPIEHLASLRAMPGLSLMRPGRRQRDGAGLAARRRGRRPGRPRADPPGRPGPGGDGRAGRRRRGRGAATCSPTADAARPTSCSSATGSEVQHCAGGGADAAGATGVPGPRGVAAVAGSCFEEQAERLPRRGPARRACPVLSVEAAARPSAGTATPTTPSASTTSARSAPGDGRHGEVRLHRRPRRRAGPARCLAPPGS